MLGMFSVIFGFQGFYLQFEMRRYFVDLYKILRLTLFDEPSQLSSLIHVCVRGIENRAWTAKIRDSFYVISNRYKSGFTQQELQEFYNCEILYECSCQRRSWGELWKLQEFQNVTLSKICLKDTSRQFRVSTFSCITYLEDFTFCFRTQML